MIEDTTPRPDTVTISADEYADLVRAAAMLDAIVIMAGGKTSKNPLYVNIANERNITIPRTED